MRLKIAAFAALISLVSATTKGAEINVYAAASLTHALREIGTNFYRQTTHRAVFNFAASSLLARQIEQAAPADVFISADEEKMNALEQRGLIEPMTRKRFLSNTLVIVVNRDSKLDLSDAAKLTQVKRIALAEPKTVPAGIYARKYLEGRGLWGQLTHKIIPTDNVRGALAAVEAGNADAAIVYATDPVGSTKVRVAYAIPPNEAPEIIYPAAVLRNAPDKSVAKRFLEYLESEAATKIFVKHGFIVPGKQRFTRAGE